VVLLSRLEETLVIDGMRHDLSTNQYAGAVHPRGYMLLESFRLDPFPIWTFMVDGVEVEKHLFLVHGENTVVTQYRVIGAISRRISLEVRPLIAFRDYHALTHENPALHREVRIHDEGLLSLRPYEDHPTLYIGHDATEVSAEAYWYKNFEYEHERERGLDYVEDLFNPLILRFDFAAADSVTVIASTAEARVQTAGLLREREIIRRNQIVEQVASEDPLVRTLAAAADQYIVSRGDQKSVIAGYPWFTDWGRDTMIALPGLTLTSNRPEITRSVLKEFAKHVNQGMLPNRFPDHGETPEYNTIDATLWYFEAVRSLIQHTKDYEFVREELYPVLEDIVEWHIRGTRFGIQVDTDSLLQSRDPNVQLTWMDAKIGDWVVTPRHGKAVEIQALWYNSLRTMQDIARAAADVPNAGKYADLAALAAQSFNKTFWNESARCLYDVVDGGIPDATMRPNQILAVSLTHSMLNKNRAKAVVDAVERHLFTPYGLRSLSPSDVQYRGRYEGNPVSRDSAYHQGPVWAWLLGPFMDAYLKVNGHGQKAQRQVRQWLEPLSAHLGDAGLGHVSEIFDGDSPHRPRGCFAQAWSVAEILRAIVDNGLTRSSGDSLRTIPA
jgi:predicted glycogen debranching enzyme